MSHIWHFRKGIHYFENMFTPFPLYYKNKNMTWGIEIWGSQGGENTTLATNQQVRKKNHTYATCFCIFINLYWPLLEVEIWMHVSRQVDVDFALHDNNRNRSCHTYNTSLSSWSTVCTQCIPICMLPFKINGVNHMNGRSACTSRMRKVNSLELRRAAWLMRL